MSASNGSHPLPLPDIPGNLVTDRGYLADLQESVAQLLHFDGNPRRFPGAQPISFASAHIQELVNEGFYVSEKADGVRCLFWTRQLGDGNVETFLIDRKNNYYRHNFGLPLPGLARPHNNTVLDGELVFEREKGEVKLFFLFFDCLVLNGKNVVDRSYSRRLGELRENVMNPYLRSCERKPNYSAKFPFRMRQKRVDFSYNLASVFEDMKKYGHKTDGLMFTSTSAPYTLGTCEKMYGPSVHDRRLKWKPADENTVDFRISATPAGDYNIEILEGAGKYSFVSELVVEDEFRQDWDEKNPDPHGKIAECRWDPDWPNHWRFCRFRDDKPDANHISVYHKILASINDNVTKEQLLEAIPAIFSAWRIREPKVKAPRSIA
ncbi:Dcp1p-Dcp2p decapping enzyme complex alpha subunit [Kappamyces sp. JEL0829]|nr:Dcp1p-Dcp2p decapping enzyme complex alpha subunit [Kappamyces sp. JEL0829]